MADLSGIFENDERVRWIGFDLDDTLHDYSGASGRALEALFIFLESRGVESQALRTSYAKILQEGLAAGFLVDRPSQGYRRDRFVKLLEATGVSTNDHLQTCLDLYDATLCNGYTCLDGAKEALMACKRQGLTVAVVTDGPHDAQERAMRLLGLDGLVDNLFSSSRYGMNKADGLLARAMGDSGFEPEECVFVGDHIGRDISPALALGMTPIFVGKGAPPEGVLQLASLQKLADFLNAGGKKS